MKAIVLDEFGGTDKLQMRELAQPVLADDQVLVKVKAISINPVDVKTRNGSGMAARMRDFKPLILGWDISGTVTALGNQVTDFKIGDEVFGMVNFPGHGKAYAEYVVAPSTHLAKKPTTIPHEEAAAATLAALTAYHALTHYASIQKGDRVFVHAASGGVGHFALQIAKHLGAYVIGSSSAKNKDFTLKIGADEHFDYKTQSLNDVSPVDFVLDCFGAENTEQSLKIVRKGGAVVSILGGATPGVIEKAKSLGVSCHAFLVQSSGQNMHSLAALLETKALRSHVSKTFSFEKMADAHAAVETGRTVGKLVVTF
jgi:NADPH:quinone reductase-like Zn-dependent oxidoreductase